MEKSRRCYARDAEFDVVYDGNGRDAKGRWSLKGMKVDTLMFRYSHFLAVSSELPMSPAGCALKLSTETEV